MLLNKNKIQKFSKSVCNLLKNQRTSVDVFMGSGEVFFSKVKSPVEVINDWNVEAQYLYKMVSVMTEEELLEITKIDLAADGSIPSLVKSIIKKSGVENGVELVKSANERLSGVTILANDFQDVIEKYDRSDTTLFLNPPKEWEEEGRLFECLQEIEKADWLMVIPASGEFAEAIAKTHEDLGWNTRLITIEKEVLIAVASYPLEDYVSGDKEVVFSKWDDSLLPRGFVVKREKMDKIAIQKMDLGPVASVDEFYTLLETACEKAASTIGFGVFGGGSGTPWVWIIDVMEDHFICELDYGNTWGHVRGFWKIENGEVVVSTEFVVVHNVRLWVGENEEVTITPNPTVPANVNFAMRETDSEFVYDIEKVDGETIDSLCGKNGPVVKTVDGKISTINFSKEYWNEGQVVAWLSGLDDIEKGATSAFQAYSVEIKKSELKKTEIKVRFLKVENQEERFVLGVVLEPNDGADGTDVDPDTQDDIYSAEEIKKAQRGWTSNYQQFGEMHEDDANTKMELAETYIAPMEMVFETGEVVKKGSWLLGATIVDDEMWKMVKAGTFTGWSVGGYAVREEL